MPLPYQAGLATGNQFGKAMRASGDKLAIDDILAQAKSQGPEYYQDAIGKILSNVSPERQQQALQAIQAIDQRNEQRRQQALKQQEYAKLGLSSLVDPSVNKEALKQRGTQSVMDQIFSSPQFGSSSIERQPSAIPESSNFDYTAIKGEIPAEQVQSLESQIIPDEKIAQLATVNPSVANQLQARNEQIRKQIERKQDVARSRFEAERKYHTQYSKPQEEEFNKLAQSTEKKEVALEFARNAVETGNLSSLSPDKLADATGFDIFRTAKGAQLITAAKENLLSNMSRVSAKGQNLWFEQRLNSMFPKIGQSKEANLTTQEMLEAETAMDKAEISAFERLAAQDERDVGYVKKDIGSRVREEVKSVKKQIFDRAKHRMRVIEEEEMGLKKLKRKVGQAVLKGTPLTISMARLYKDKFGEKSKEMAIKNGYSIPTIEDLRMYETRPSEFRESL